MIIIKEPSEIELIRKGGEILARVLIELREVVKAGVNTWIINKKAEELVRKMGAKPAFKGYKPAFSKKRYPFATCISVNNEVVHGLPSKVKFLKEGDIVSVDMGVEYKGYYADAAYTYTVGEPEERVKELVEVTKEALYKGIEKAVAGNRIGDISHAIEKTVKAHGFSPVKDYCGHGVGRYIHEDPAVPNEGTPGKGELIRVGMTLAIEPMVAMGSGEIEIRDDGWTAVTKDGSWAAHFEHTIAVLEEGPEILTKWE